MAYTRIVSIYSYDLIDVKNVDSFGSWTLVGNMSVDWYRHAVVPLGFRGPALFVASDYIYM